MFCFHNFGGFCGESRGAAGLGQRGSCEGQGREGGAAVQNERVKVISSISLSEEVAH